MVKAEACQYRWCEIATKDLEAKEKTLTKWHKVQRLMNMKGASIATPETSALAMSGDHAVSLRILGLEFAKEYVQLRKEWLALKDTIRQSICDHLKLEKGALENDEVF